MKEKTWKILDYGKVPPGAPTHDVGCSICYTEAKLPMIGLPMAQMGQSIIFDIGVCHLPAKIQCRKCRRVFELVNKVNNLRR